MLVKWAVAQAVCNESDMLRFACVFLYTENGITDWNAAAADFGSASVASFRRMISDAKKKIKERTEGTMPVEAATPKSAKGKASNAATTKKRKRVIVEAESKNDPDDADEDSGRASVQRVTKKKAENKDEVGLGFVKKITKKLKIDDGDVAKNDFSDMDDDAV